MKCVVHSENIEKNLPSDKGGFDGKNGTVANWNDPSDEVIAEIERRKSEVRASHFKEVDDASRELAKRVIALRREGLRWEDIRKLFKHKNWQHLKTLAENYGNEK